LRTPVVLLTSFKYFGNLQNGKWLVANSFSKDEVFSSALQSATFFFVCLKLSTKTQLQAKKNPLKKRVSIFKVSKYELLVV